MADDITTTDIGLAAYLRLLGFPLLGIEGREGRRTFRFPPAVADAASHYFLDATVKARDYAESLRSVKGLLNNSARFLNP